MRRSGLPLLPLLYVAVAWVISFLGIRVGEALRPGPSRRKEIDRSVPLEQDISDRTRGQYEEGEKLLDRFLHARGMTAEELAELPARALGTQVSEFVRWAWDDEAVTRNVVESALASFGFRFFWAAPFLKPANRLVRSWRNREALKMRIPVSKVACRAIIAVCFAWGWYGAGVLFWTGFSGLLRPAEMHALKGSLVRLVRRGTLAVIVIEEAKTWRRSARRQHVLIDDPLLLRAFAYLKRHLHPEAPWFPFTPDTLSNRLNAVLRAIGIVGYVTLASFRTGGATEDWMQNRNLPALRIRGRWALEQTLEHYVQESICFLQEEEFSSSARARIEELSRLAPGLIRAWGC